jgi:hypothetical protein
MDILDWLENERRHVFLTVIILCLLPVIFPLQLPLIVEYWTEDAFDYIENMEPGDIGFVIPDIAGATMAELYPGCVAIAKHLLQQGCRVVFTTFRPDGEIVMRQLIEEAGFIEAEERGEIEYGVDYLVIPYISGAESGYAQLARDTPSVFQTDLFGNSQEDLPIMEDLKSFRDVKYVAFASAVRPDPFIRQWTPYVDTTGFCIIGLSFYFSQYFVYLRSGQAIGFINGLKGTAEYEILLGVPGKGITFMDQASLTHIYVVILMILGNYMMYKGVKRRYTILPK